MPAEAQVQRHTLTLRWLAQSYQQIRGQLPTDLHQAGLGSRFGREAFEGEVFFFFAEENGKKRTGSQTLKGKGKGLEAIKKR